MPQEMLAALQIGAGDEVRAVALAVSDRLR